jgi:hypothetical protein
VNLLSDIITYVRRIIKSPSNAQITDNLIIDYINRFWIMDVDARMQLFDLKTKYAFQTIPGVDRYNMPLYNFQSETPGDPASQDIGMYPVYQGFVGPCYINGIQVPLNTQKNSFFNIWPNVVQDAVVVAVGNGGPTYTITLPVLPGNSNPVNTPVEAILRGHVDIAGIIATGSNQDPPIGTVLNNVAGIPTISTTSIDPSFYLTSTDATGANVVVQDSGQFLTGNVNYGLLMVPGSAPYGYSPYANPGNPSIPYSTTLNTINYFTGIVNVTFPVSIPTGVNINAQYFFFQTGLPRSILFYNNTLTLRSPPDRQYLVEIDAYLSPAAFFNTGASIPFAYMAEYIARGSARKILSDTGDMEQFQFYEPLFREQELLVWKRSQRQWTASRTETIYSQGINQGQSGFNNVGGSTF